MRKSSLLFILLFCCAFTTQQKTITFDTTVKSQIRSEREIQDKLPQSHHPTWAAIAKTKITENQTTGIYTAVVPDEVKQWVGKEITVTGFVLPLEEKEKFRHLLLSRRTPVCFFHPPGEPNEVMEVLLEKPILWSDKMISITGKFELINNGEKGLFFRLTGAKING